MLLKNEKETIIDLLQKEDLKIIQRSDYFSFSLDTILVAEFLSVGRGVNKIVDLGTGNGAIPLFLSKRTKAKIIGFELQDVSADLAERNISLNNLCERIKIVHDDMRNWSKYFNHGSQDAVVCNPPFFKFKGDERLLNDLDQLTLARHEISITLIEIIEIASKILKDKGYFALVHRADRLIEIIELLRKFSLEPKRLQFCHSKTDKPAKIILIEGLKYGSEGMTILPPLFTHETDGKYSSELLKLFE
ncbi:MAG: tRNA1(Val) (adenine(37)-N6)-methyltransferase [Fusobacteriaceae bacterium]